MAASELRPGAQTLFILEQENSSSTSQLCKHTTCIKCGHNPKHKYEPIDSLLLFVVAVHCHCRCRCRPRRCPRPIIIAKVTALLISSSRSSLLPSLRTSFSGLESIALYQKSRSHDKIHYLIHWKARLDSLGAAASELGLGVQAVFILGETSSSSLSFSPKNSQILLSLSILQ